MSKSFIEIVITPANVQWEHFYIPKDSGFFPEDAWGGSNASVAGAPITVEFDGTKESVSTDIDGTKRILRSARGQMARFYSHHGLVGGETIQVIQVGARTYRVRHGAESATRISTPYSLSIAQQIPSFVVNKAYSRKEHITGQFGGSGQSGIAPSNKSPVIFLFTGGSGEQYGYNDLFDEEFGFLLYTGEGQVGDMTMSRGNLAIATHAADGRALHVFKTTGKGKPCLYMGEFVYGSHFLRRGPDKDGNERDVIVFRLIPVSNLLQVELGDATEEGNLHTIVDSDSRLSLTELREAAIAACQSQVTIPDSKETVRITYLRCAQVKRYVLARAKGYCELCGEPAPFNRKSDGTPYLEPHHINRLSDGGLDHPLHVGAICPTCHRKIHFGINGSALNEELRAKVEAMEEKMSGVE